MKYIKRCLTLAIVLLLSLGACGKREDPPASAADAAEQGIQMLREAFDVERKKLEVLQKVPSVTSASIDINSDLEQYRIDLDDATASIRTPGQEMETYSLDPAQIDGINRLLSEYTLTVYDGNPYWPSGDYCTMIELFDYSIHYDGGYYREYGATHYPENWEGFMEELKGFIVSGD